MKTIQNDKNSLTEKTGKEDVFSVSEMVLVLLVTAFIFIFGFLAFKAATDVALITDNRNTIMSSTSYYLSDQAT